MKKQELIHLHGLLYEIEEYLEEEYLEGELESEEYESLDIRPTDIHRWKDDHKEAIFSLSDSITDYIEENEGRKESPDKPATD